jgi:hypothetical protein
MMKLNQQRGAEFAPRRMNQGGGRELIAQDRTVKVNDGSSEG